MARLFSGGYSTLISTIAAIFAVLYIAEVDPEEFKAEESAVFTQSPEELFDHLTNADHVPQVSQAVLPTVPLNKPKIVWL